MANPRKSVMWDDAAQVPRSVEANGTVAEVVHARQEVWNGSAWVPATAGGSAVSVADGADVTQGAVADTETASGNGTVVSILKRLRTLLAGGLPAALAAGGGLKVEGVAGGVAQPVSGTFWQSAQPVTDNGGSLTIDAVDTSLGATVTPKAASVWDVSDRSARLVGSIANAFALDSTVAKAAPQTDGTQKAITRGGAKGATTAADMTSTAEGADHQAADIQVYHGGVAKDPTAIRALTSADIVTAAQGAAAATAAAWPAKVTDGTNIAAVKAASTAAAAADPSLVVGQSPNSPTPAGTNRIGSVRPVDSADADLTAAKNAQTARFVGVQASKDAGRSQVMLAWEEMAGTAAAESALTNFTLGSRAASALGAATNLQVSAGKTLRIQLVTVYVKATSTVNNLARFRIRQAGTIANTSPVIWDTVIGHELATDAASVLAHQSYPIPDGLEVAAGQQIAFTWFTAATTCTVGMTLVGYEY